jgi:uncharacterized protein
MSVRVRRAMDDPSVVSFFHGPVLLVGMLGTQDMPASDLATSPQGFHERAVPPVPALTSDLPSALAPVPNQPLNYRVRVAGMTNGPTHITLVPFYELHHQRYTIYWRTQR